MHARATTNDPVKNAVDLHIRLMIRRDMPEVLEIEKACFPHPWTEEDFIRCLRRRDVIGMVAEYKGDVVGFDIYELHKNRICILSIATRSDLRRHGIGTQLIDKLKSKMSPQRRHELNADVSEYSLNAQLFFRSQGFRCAKILRDHFNDGSDAYFMRYRVRKSDGEQS